MTLSDVHKTLETSSCAELTKRFCDTAEQVNSALNAFITITRDTAHQSALAADTKTRSDGAHALTGVPFALADAFMTDGILTTCGSKMLHNFVPYYDAAVWEILRGLDAPLIGKANMDEFAMGVTGETGFRGAALNPHDAKRTAGGASGGIAAAVAASLVPYGIGMDTGGGVRVPAAFCGVYGFRPTYGALSRHGMAAYASGLDQTGIVAAAVRDIAAVFDAVCAQDNRDMTSLGSKPVSGGLSGTVSGKKIGIVRALTRDLPSDTAAVFNESARTLEKLGAALVDIDIPYIEFALSAYTVIACAQASSNLGRFDGLRFGYAAENYTDIDDFIARSRTESFGAEVKNRVLFGTYALSAGHYGEYYGKATQLALAINNAFAAAMRDVDLIITPTTARTAPLIGSNLTFEQSADIEAFTAPFSIAGMPAISVPCGTGADGLPLGLQIAGRRFGDAEVLSAALCYEVETGAEHVKITKGGVAL